MGRNPHLDSIVKVGHLLRIVEDGQSIKVDFDFDFGIAPFPFARLEPLRVLLGLGDESELKTTHWTIKNADLLRILGGAGLRASTPSSTGGPLLPTPRGATLSREPELELLLAALRRLGDGGVRPLLKRRHHRPSITISDEHDMQDVVDVLLRALYQDVRCEEPTPTSAGSHSRMDMQIRNHRLAVEVKVTAPGRGNAAIKQEILRDINDYQNHPHVGAVVFAIYDLANTFTNATGFENDFTGRREQIDVIVLVIPWVVPPT